MRATCLARFESGLILMFWSLQFLHAYDPSTPSSTWIALKKRSLSSTVTRAVPFEAHYLHPSLAEKDAGISHGSPNRGFDLNLSPEGLCHEEVPADMTNMADSVYVADEEFPHRPPGAFPPALHPQIPHDYLGAAGSATSEHSSRYPTREFLPRKPGGVRSDFKDAYSAVDSPNYLSLGGSTHSARLQQNVHFVPQSTRGIQPALDLESPIAPLTLGATDTHRWAQIPAGLVRTYSAHQGFSPVSTIAGSHTLASGSQARMTPESESPPSGILGASSAPLKTSAAKSVEIQLRLNDQQPAAAPEAASADLERIPRAEFDPSSKRQAVGWKASRQRLVTDPAPSLSLSHHLERAPSSQPAQKVGGELTFLESDSSGPREPASPRACSVPPFEMMWERARQTPPRNTEACEPVVEPRIRSEPQTISEGDRPVEADRRLESTKSPPSNWDSQHGPELMPSINYYTRIDKKSRPLVAHAHESPALGFGQSPNEEGYGTALVATARRSPDPNKSPSPASAERESYARETRKSAPYDAAVRFQSDSAAQSHEVETSQKSRKSQSEESSPETNELDTSDEDYLGTDHIPISQLPIKSMTKTRKMASVAQVAKTSSRPVRKNKGVPLHSQLDYSQSSDTQVRKTARQSNQKTDKGKEVVAEKRKISDTDQPELQSRTQEQEDAEGIPIEEGSDEGIWDHANPPWWNQKFLVPSTSFPEITPEEGQMKVTSASSSPSEATMPSSKRPKTIKTKPISSLEAQKAVAGGSQKTQAKPSAKSKKQKQQVGSS